MLRLVLPALLVVLAACTADGPPPGGDSTSASPARATIGDGPAGTRDAMDDRLDSVLVRFRAELPAVTQLADGEPSIEALTRRFVRALERADTNDLRAMVMTRAEFAYLYYPGSAYTRRPTRQEADLVWFLHLQDSQKGVSRALARYGTLPVRLIDHECAAEPVQEGANTIWHGCVVRIAPSGDTLRLRLFGPILERGGTFKFYSYRNDL